VGRPGKQHPKRPVHGFSCKRSEVSGRRLWGWARETFSTPQRFFSGFFVVNYCPLLFIEKTGHNRTPNQIHADERIPLFLACDRALRRTMQYLRARYVIGIGRFAEERARESLIGLDVLIGYITHPSAANPVANRNWKFLITEQLRTMGIQY
jgi:single-strand selective monofunctional uracil DNA glycosylase